MSSSSLKPKKLDSARKPNLDSARYSQNRTTNQSILESGGSLWQHLSQSLAQKNGQKSQNYDNGNNNYSATANANNNDKSSGSFKKKKQSVIPKEGPHYQYMIGNMAHIEANSNSQNKQNSQRKMNSFKKPLNSHQVSLQVNQESKALLKPEHGHNRYSSNFQRQRQRQKNSETFDFDSYQVKEEKQKLAKREGVKSSRFDSVYDENQSCSNDCHIAKNQKILALEGQMLQITTYLNQERETIKEVILRESSKIKQLQKVIKDNKVQYQGYLNSLVSKLNEKMGASERKLNNFQDQAFKNDRKTDLLDQRLAEFTNWTRQKIQELTTQIDVFVIGNTESGLKKSKIGNTNLGYSVNLKNSVNNVQQQMNQQILDQFKAEIQALKNQIKGIRAKAEEREVTKVENIKTQSVPQNNAKMQKMKVQLEKLNEQFESLKKVVQTRLNEHKSMICTLQQNQIMMNQSFERCVNIQIAKKIQQVEKQLSNVAKKTPSVVEEILGKALDQKTSKYKILRIRQTTHMEKEKLTTKGISYKETYLLDEEGYLLDSEGVYLTDQSKEKIRIYQDQIYFLQLQGMQILQAK